MPRESKTLQDIAQDLWKRNVIPVNTSNDDDVRLVNDLQKVMIGVMNNIIDNPIQKKRPNEVGNAIENPIMDGIKSFPGYQASRPTDINGNTQSSGYPDLLIKDPASKYSYIECKTYNRNSLNSAFRSFYLSPPAILKVIHDARHILVAFEVEELPAGGYIANGFKLVDLHGLMCKLKTEWNANNRDLYAQPILNQFPPQTK